MMPMRRGYWVLEDGFGTRAKARHPVSARSNIRPVGSSPVHLAKIPSLALWSKQQEAGALGDGTSCPNDGDFLAAQTPNPASVP
jgi:hypothetical protein